MIDISFFGNEKLNAMPNRFKKTFLKSVRTHWAAAGNYFIRLIVREQMSGRVGLVGAGADGGLNRRTGRLARSWWSRSEVVGDNVHAVVFTDAPYARIHQMGGTITGRGGARIRMPKRLAVLEAWDKQGLKYYRNETAKAIAEAVHAIR